MHYLGGCYRNNIQKEKQSVRTTKMKNYKIRKAEITDIDRINCLLYQVAKIHAEGRPDIFKTETKKYTDEQLISIINDPQTPVFVAVDDDNTVYGYAFCICQEVKDNTLLCDRRTLYIDDLCVDEVCRGKSVGTLLYNHVTEYAKENGFDAITLNVWCLNESALGFYRKLGLSPLKYVMEERLK